jgi:hypothetical protein
MERLNDVSHPFIYVASKRIFSVSPLGSSTAAGGWGLGLEVSILPRLQSTSQYLANKTAQLGQFIASSFSRPTASSATASVSLTSTPYTLVHAAPPSSVSSKLTAASRIFLVGIDLFAPVSTPSTSYALTPTTEPPAPVSIYCNGGPLTTFAA